MFMIGHMQSVTHKHDLHCCSLRQSNQYIKLWMQPPAVLISRAKVANTCDRFGS